MNDPLEQEDRTFQKLIESNWSKKIYIIVCNTKLVIWCGNQNLYGLLWI